MAKIVQEVRMKLRGAVMDPVLWMVSGQTGVCGQTVHLLVAMGQSPGTEHVTILAEYAMAKPVQGYRRTRQFVTQICVLLMVILMSGVRGQRAVPLAGVEARPGNDCVYMMPLHHMVKIAQGSTMIHSHAILKTAQLMECGLSGVISHNAQQHVEMELVSARENVNIDQKDLPIETTARAQVLSRKFVALTSAQLMESCQNGPLGRNVQKHVTMERRLITGHVCLTK